MTAAEKRKLVSMQLFELLAPYGYFLRYGAIWKYSMDGKYVVCLSSELSSYGTLNEISIGFGSFFAPLHLDSYAKKRLNLHGLDLAYYVRNVGLGIPLLNCNLSFQEQIDSIFPFFQSIIFPRLPTSDDLSDYVSKSEQLLQLRTEAFQGIPCGIGIKGTKEIAFAYLSLDRPEEALRAISQYAQQCRYAADYIGSHVEIFKYDIEKQIRHWEENGQEALKLKNAIETDGGKVFGSEITQRETESAELCRQFFHISKR